MNGVVYGAIILAISGIVVASLHKLPGKIWEWFIRRVSVVVDVSNDDPLFGWVSLWLAEQPYSQRTRSLTATSERDEYGRILTPSNDNNDLPQVLLTPSVGNHLFRYNSRLVWLSRERKDSPGSKDETFIGGRRLETFKLRVVGRKQGTAKDLLEDARACALKRRQKKVEIFTAAYDYWNSIDERDPRPLSSVFLPGNTIEEVKGDIERFLSSQAWYAERGIPWRRRYCFYGVPRSGKTSLICALAGLFRMNLYILNLGGPYLTDDSLMSLMSKVPARSFILLEDIDCAFNERHKSDDARNKLTFSGLLNALDGAASKEGSLIFLTTNHINKLDPALIGPGRADYKIEFTYATADQANRMFLSYFPEAQSADGFGYQVERVGMSMADVQNHLIKNRDSCLLALNSLSQKTVREPCV